MDWLEKQILEKQRSLQEPPKGHLSRFEARLDANFGKTKHLKWKIPAYVAASIAILIGVLAFLSRAQNEQSKTLILADVSTEYSESEIFFQQEINERIRAIESFNGNNSNYIKDIEGFDRSLQNLKSDLKEAPGDPRVVDAVMQTYMLKIEALDNIVDILKKTS